MRPRIKRSTRARLLRNRARQSSPRVRVSAVFPKQGHYAFDPDIPAECPPADIELAEIGDLVTYDLPAILKKK